MPHKTSIVFEEIHIWYADFYRFRDWPDFQVGLRRKRHHQYALAYMPFPSAPPKAWFLRNPKGVGDRVPWKRKKTSLKAMKVHERAHIAALIDHITNFGKTVSKWRSK